MTAARLRNTGRFIRPANGATAEYSVTNLRELKRLMNPATRTPTPIRPVGARSACTSCNSTPSGTVISIDALDNILNIDTFNNTVTAQAGIRIYRLAEVLAEHGLELVVELGQRDDGLARHRPLLGDERVEALDSLVAHRLLRFPLPRHSRPPFAAPSCDKIGTSPSATGKLTR